MSRRRFGSQVAVGALGREHNPGAAWRIHTGENKANREAWEGPQDKVWDTDAGFLQLLYYMSKLITNSLNPVITACSTNTTEPLLKNY